MQGQLSRDASSFRGGDGAGTFTVTNGSQTNYGDLMSDIFISYSSDDKSRVEPLAEVLAARGWSVWWDRSIPAGKTFDDVIEEAIDAARCIVVVWSDKSVSSSWVRTEADEGAIRQILVPVLIDKVKIPLAFRRIQAANLIDWQGTLPHPGFDQLVKDISSLIGPPARQSTTGWSDTHTPPYERRPKPAPQRSKRSADAHAPSFERGPTPKPQRSSPSPLERKPGIGLMAKIIPIALLIIWLLGVLGHVGGALIHLALLLALVLILMNILRWLTKSPTKQ